VAGQSTWQPRQRGDLTTELHSIDRYSVVSVRVATVHVTRRQTAAATEAVTRDRSAACGIDHLSVSLHCEFVSRHVFLHPPLTELIPNTVTKLVTNDITETVTHHVGCEPASKHVTEAVTNHVAHLIADLVANGTANELTAVALLVLTLTTTGTCVLLSVRGVTRHGGICIRCTGAWLRLLGLLREPEFVVERVTQSTRHSVE